MPEKSDTDRRDLWWLDDATSLVIVGLVITTLLALLAGSAYAVTTGAVDVDTRIQIAGTIPIDTILLGVLAGIGWMVYVAFTDIYGARDVTEATDSYRSVTEDADTPRPDRDQEE